MTAEGFRCYCLARKEASEDFPFDETTVVYKVGGKMFALVDTGFKRINVKCAPLEALALREKYQAVIPGYHMNKKHWNSLIMDGSLPDELVYKWLDNSYKLVLGSLPQSKQRELA
jgi:predicted DNA-binding protein (MmcQ/YjbR family)